MRASCAWADKARAIVRFLSICSTKAEGPGSRPFVFGSNQCPLLAERGHSGRSGLGRKIRSFKAGADANALLPVQASRGVR